MRLPSADDISWGPADLDGQSAVRAFLGKTLPEAEAMIRERTFAAQHLLWMKPVGFRFYFQAAIAYAESEQASGNSDIINILADTLSHWNEWQPADLVPCADRYAAFCKKVVQEFARYDANPEIYVGLYEQYENLAMIFKGMLSKS